MSKLYRIDTRKRVTIPDEMLKKIDAQEGDYIKFIIENGDVKIKKIKFES